MATIEGPEFWEPPNPHVAHADISQKPTLKEEHPE